MPKHGKQKRKAKLPLFEHPDFEQAILQAEEHFRARKLRPAIIEKDYYVTEVLRILAETNGEKIIFKGGTSLVKGWNLIQRFSEDIDIFLDPNKLEQQPNPRAIDRELKKLRDFIEKHPALTLMESEGKTVGGFGRNDSFSYKQLFGGVGEVVNRVLVETGTASGREPSVRVELRSYLSEFLKQKGMSLGAEDETPFSLRLLHFRRTFVEKMFAIHSKVELLKRDNRPLGTYARHYYDLFQISQYPEVDAMLRSKEYAEIKSDYDRISKVHFPQSYFFPEAMSFAKSDALFPPAQLAAIISTEYESQCKLLCYGPYPSWDKVQERFLKIKALL